MVGTGAIGAYHDTRGGGTAVDGRQDGDGVVGVDHCHRGRVSTGDGVVAVGGLVDTGAIGADPYTADRKAAGDGRQVVTVLSRLIIDTNVSVAVVTALYMEVVW